VDDEENPTSMYIINIGKHKRTMYRIYKIIADKSKNTPKRSNYGTLIEEGHTITMTKR
jgi:hypothetical protein